MGEDVSKSHVDLRPFPSTARANWTLIVLLAAYILSFIDRQILSLLVGPIRADLGISDFQISLLQGTAFALFYVFLGIPFGRLADSAPRTIIIAFGVFIWSGMTALCGVAQSFGSLFLSRVGVGVGEATLSPAGYSLLSDSFPAGRLTRATSIFTMGITVGGGLGYIIGGSIVHLVSASHEIGLPLIGLLKPWRLAFLIVGLPGLIIGSLVLGLREPFRHEPGTDNDARVKPSIRQAFAFMLAHRQRYAPIFLSVSLLSILGYGTLNWYPTFLLRAYGLSVQSVGLTFGTIYLIFGTLGALASAVLAEKLAERGYQDANLRVVLWASVGLIVPAGVGPLMPNAPLALALAAPTVFLLSAYYGVSMAALQLVTPNRMRGLMSSLFLLVTNVSGLVIGTSLIALLTDKVFHDDSAVRYSLASAAIVVCPAAAWIIGGGLRRYRSALEPTLDTATGLSG